MNGIPQHFSYIRSSPHQHTADFSHFQINSTPTNSLSTNLFHHLLRQKGELLNQDHYFQPQPSSSFDEPIHYPSSSHFVHSPGKN